MTRILTPDDYRKASGYRRSEAAPRLPAVQAYQSYDLESLDAPDFMRGRQSVAGISVNDRMLLRNSTFNRGASLISGSMGMLPMNIMRRKADGTTEKATDHQTYRLLRRRPNAWMTPFEFKSYMQLCALIDGRACAYVVRQNGQPRQYIPLPRHSVTPKLGDDFQLRFEYRPKQGGTKILQPEEVFHFRSPLSLDGVNGVGLADVAVDTIGISVKALQAVGNLMSKGVMAGGALETDKTLGEEAIGNLKTSLQEIYAGAENAGDWMVLEEGLKAKLFGGTAKDAQLTELRRLEAEEGSRFTGVPRPLLMFDETSWGSGIEQLGLFFVTYCLNWWFVIWEEAVFRTLPEREQESRDGSLIYAKYNERALLRGSMKDQAEFLSRALGSGGGRPWMAQNEAREQFDMNPKPGFDELPRDGTTAAAVVEEDDDDDKA